MFTILDYFHNLYSKDIFCFSLLLIFVVILLGAILGMVFYLFACLFIEIYKRTILRRKIINNSDAIDKLILFNASLPENYFVSVENDHDYSKIVHNRRSFNNISHRNILKEWFLKRHNYFTMAIKLLENNCTNYKEYCRNCEAIFKNRSIEWYGTHDYSEYEESLFRLLMLQPDLDILLTTHCRYTTPSGRYHYHSKQVFTLIDLKSIQKELQQQEEFELSKKHQRSLMSDSLRYDIMKRDGFACVLCGATQKDGAKLHIDHIRPVAKGGLTEPNNLRTLCEQCNLGKRDKYDPSGVN